MLTEYVCARWYRAPEIMICRKQYDCKVDIWSVGCIWSEMLLGRPIFEGANHFELLSSMFSILGTPLFNNDDTHWIIDNDALNWIKTLNKSSGCDLRKVFNSTLPEAVDVLSRMLILNPRQRCTVNDALSAPYFHRYEHYFRRNKKCEPFHDCKEIERSMNTGFGARS